MNLRAAAYFLGRLVLLVAAAQLVPLACSAIYQEWQAVRAFFISAVIAALVGYLLIRYGRERGEAYRREGIAGHRCPRSGCRDQLHRFGECLHWWRE